MGINRKALLVVLLLTCIGLYYSIFVLSIAPFLLLVLSLFEKDIKPKLLSFFTKPKVFGLSLILVLYVLSGLNSADKARWLSRVNSNLVYWFIPLAIYLLGPFKRKLVDAFLAIFVLVTSVVSIKLLVAYLLNFEAVNASYLVGKTIETPIIHVRYSYFVAIAIIASIYLSVTKFTFFDKKREHYLYIGSTVFLTAFVHLLAVRTGLLALYVTVLVSGIYYVVRYKQYKLGGVLMSGLLVFLIIAYNCFPTFKNKISYVKWDVSTTLNDNAEYHNSDRIRINSIVNGLKIIKDAPVFGSGVGDIESAINEKYQETYPDLPMDQRFPPISQFVFTFASLGVLGGLIFYGLLCIPLLFYNNRHRLIAPFYILTFTTFIGENTIELIIGKTAFLLMVCILMNTEETNKVIVAA